MQILLSVNAAWNIWNFRRPVVEALIADGHRVTVLAPRDDSVTKLENLGCRFLPLDMSVKGLNPLQDLKLFHRFKRIFRTEQPDVILSYTIKNNIFGAMAASKLNIPFIPNVTGLGTAFLSGGVLQKIAESLYRKAFSPLSTIFFQNEDDRGLFIDRRLVTRDQAQLLPGSGIDLERFAATEFPGESEAPIFLMIARLLRDKGVLEFVEAARQVKSTHPRARFQLLGAVDAANRTAIDAATVRSWQEEGVIEYLGTSEDVRPYIAAAHCVVLPSYREGAPRTLIEAAAMARPLIATDVPGCRTVVDRDVTGYLCEVRNASDLAERIESFLTLPQADKAAMGQAGRAKMAAEFDQSLVVKAYRDVMDAQRPTPNNERNAKSA
ncbi:glycosyltransferase family 4 protein [Tateyamaria pelophila]|uniref:glycosyltransferase family 4 protein n=1 Tax=Tateyamaria pelophila TaxID=328415 RepID=UPI001CBE3C8C|nr:glycosyltransferase family 4 protein [Tateyamaria pelophila]